jgi:hypothetical protein
MNSIPRLLGTLPVRTSLQARDLVHATLVEHLHSNKVVAQDSERKVRTSKLGS